MCRAGLSARGYLVVGAMHTVMTLFPDKEFTGQASVFRLLTKPCFCRISRDSPLVDLAAARGDYTPILTLPL